LASFNLGRAYLETHQDAKAADALQRAIDINPTDAILNSAAYTLAENKSSLDIAEKWAAQAINEVETEVNQTTLHTQSSRLSSLPDKLAMYWDTLGWIKFQQGDFGAAEKYVFAAWQMRNDMTIGDHLGQIYAAQDNKEQAAEMFSEVVDNLPPNHEMTKDELDAAYELAKLRAARNMNEDRVVVARDLLRSVRLVKVNNTAQVQGISQYLLLIGPDSKVLDVEAIRSDSGLDKLADSLRSTPLPQSFPDATIQKVPRVGTLACMSPEQSCTLTLASTASASRALPSASE
jgi:tetratricopeptide (TPR) repeat protein